MAKSKFNPHKYLNKQDKQEVIPVEKTHHTQNATIPNNDVLAEVEEIVKRIEDKQIDLTKSYSDWRDIGFALSDTIGEQGRSYFHRISRFYCDYNQSECDQQYNKCLKSNNSGVTIKSFFHKAKMAGVNINTKKQDVAESSALPCFPESIYEQLPELLKNVCIAGNNQYEKDILLLSAITTLSACVPNVYGVYDNRKVYANLYFFLTAQASAGKGIINHCKRLVAPIHAFYREQSQLLKTEYEREMNIYNSTKKDNPNAEKPQKPPEKLLFIPANSSATGAFQLLFDNEGKGLIFETEGDTLANTFKSDYGKYDDGFRKAFHHETITYYRRTDREYVDIDTPCLSAVLSGTPNQVHNLISDAENGLFSRFMFYSMEMKTVWKDVFAKRSNNGLDQYFDDLGNQYYELYKLLKANFEIEFTLSFKSQQLFNQTFESWQRQKEYIFGKQYTATVRRLGLITFRMAMIFSVLRILETGEQPRVIECYDEDFNIALAITEALLQHSGKIFNELPATTHPVKRENRRDRFYNQLPVEFSRQDYVKVAEELNIPDKTAQGYIAKFIEAGLLHRDTQNQYIKLSAKETEDKRDV